MLAVAVFCVAIYFWAVKVALSTERIEQMLNEVVIPEEEMDEGGVVKA
jgi:hypothetical protein